MWDIIRFVLPFAIAGLMPIFALFGVMLKDAFEKKDK